MLGGQSLQEEATKVLGLGVEDAHAIPQIPQNANISQFPASFGGSRALVLSDVLLLNHLYTLICISECIHTYIHAQIRYISISTRIASHRH